MVQRIVLAASWNSLISHEGREAAQKSGKEMGRKQKRTEEKRTSLSPVTNVNC